jgi:uncharacterized RDD family membrane protein YckC
MNPENHSLSNPKASPIQVNLDEFTINEDSFKPMTKGLGFHQDQKRSSFAPAPKEVKAFGTVKDHTRASVLLNPLSGQAASAAAGHMPSGLEAFYGTKGTAGTPVHKPEIKIDLPSEKNEIKTKFIIAPAMLQFFAWVIDVLVVSSFVAITGALLVLASGIQYKIFARLINNQDLIAFTAAIFSIYYLLYFTILDLSASPGKTILGLRILKSDNTNVSVKHTFLRALISLLSSIALFLPMLLDFQGRLSDTKVVK